MLRYVHQINKLFLLIYLLPPSTKHSCPPITLTNRALLKIEILVTTQNSNVIFLPVGWNNYSFAIDRHRYNFSGFIFMKKMSTYVTLSSHLLSSNCYTFYPSLPSMAAQDLFKLSWHDWLASFHSENPDTPQFPIHQ